MKKTRVMIIDDSALMRELLKSIFSQDPALEVVGAFTDPIAASSRIAALAPDVMTLDVEMPRMDGLSFLEELMRTRPMPVLMVSSLTERGCDVTLRALELGAIDFVTKPKLDIARGTVERADELIAKVKAAASARVRPLRMTPIAQPQTPPARVGEWRRTEGMVAIGASTGGTEALKVLLTALPADASPIAIVQHMPPVFTRQFAERLDQICRIRVREAADGDVLLTGHALIAPGGDTHLEIVRSGARFQVRLRKTPPLNHHRPSVDVMFHSCAQAAGQNAVGIILTGMGNDGAQGLLAMRRAGAHTIAQDEASSVVFGMPKEAIELGAAETVLPLERIAGALIRMGREESRDAKRVGGQARSAWKS